MGRAMGEGGIGDTVTVQNPASFRMIIGRRHRRPAPCAPPARPRPFQPQSHRPQLGFAMHKPVLKFSALLLLGTALCGCSAVDRIENIGETPKLAPVGNPADTQIVGRHSGLAADQP